MAFLILVRTWHCWCKPGYDIAVASLYLIILADGIAHANNDVALSQSGHDIVDDGLCFTATFVHMVD